MAPDGVVTDLNEDDIMATTVFRTAAAVIFALVFTACTPTDASTPEASDTSADGSDAGDNEDSPGDGSDTSGPATDLGLSFTHKMMKSTGENQFAALGYECFECTFEQFAAIKPQRGWSKGPAQVVLAKGELRSRPSFEGVPDAMDFVPEIPGSEYELIVKNLDARLIEFGEGGLIVEAQVMRDTVLRFPAGSRVHELTDPDENTFVLFAYGIDPADIEFPDFQDADALGDLIGPAGWTYSSRVLDDELTLDTPSTATVLAIRSEHTSTWQKR